MPLREVIGLSFLGQYFKGVFLEAVLSKIFEFSLLVLSYQFRWP